MGQSLSQSGGPKAAGGTGVDRLMILLPLILASGECWRGYGCRRSEAPSPPSPSPPPSPPLTPPPLLQTPPLPPPPPPRQGKVSYDDGDTLLWMRMAYFMEQFCLLAACALVYFKVPHTHPPTHPPTHPHTHTHTLAKLLSKSIKVST